MEALVQLTGVTKRYDSGAAAVDEASLQITAAATLGMALLANSSGPFDRAFAVQHGAEVAATVDSARATGTQLAATARLPGVRYATGVPSGPAVLKHAAVPKRVRVKRSAAALAGAVAAGLLAAACSSSPSATGQLTTAQADRGMVNFAHCMRAHGVQMPDPFHIPGHTGLSIYDPPRTAATRAAWAACGHFVQPTVNMKQGHQQALAALRLRALTDYARCMRGHNIAMLDPTSLGEVNLGNVPGISSDFGRYSPQFRAADAACRHLLPAGVVDDGTGP